MKIICRAARATDSDRGIGEAFVRALPGQGAPRVSFGARNPADAAALDPKALERRLAGMLKRTDVHTGQ